MARRRIFDVERVSLAEVKPTSRDVPVLPKMVTPARRSAALFLF
uniref:Uncharacterized protein n=1 Tax=uncultured prokaryote TaxID=198431 RepID=A0A0H5QLN4_9ZZZZ|nr:hypothetical protein [uncultured prokaryote]